MGQWYVYTQTSVANFKYARKNHFTTMSPARSTQGRSSVNRIGTMTVSEQNTNQYDTKSQTVKSIVISLNVHR